MSATTLAFECSKQDAKVNISNSEWINEFRDGIVLEKGDSVRLLGSFVNEASSGDEIEITNDMSVNIQYSPYLKAQTFFTADKGTDLIDLSKIGDIPYSTDSFGIEPPGWWFSDGQATDGSAANRATANFTYNAGSDNLYGDVYATGTGNIHWNNGGAEWQSQNNFARTWGTNIKTYNNNTTQQTATDFNESHLYSDWGNFSCDNELYIAGLVKKLILPVLYSCNTTSTPNGGGVNIFENLVDDPPVAGVGMLAGIPKVGHLITTVDIAGATGLYDEDGNGYFQTDIKTGEVNLTAGPQSVIGEVIAVRPIKHLIRGRTTNCFEVLVSNWVSPASIRSKPIVRNAINGSSLSSALSFDINKMTATQITGNASVDCIVQVHGSGETRKDYNTNSTYNNINGSFNKGSTVLEANNPDNNNGLMSGNPDVYTYDSLNGEASTALGNKIGKGTTNFGESCLDSNLTQYKLGFGKPQGLSFLWNGTYGSQYRYVRPTTTAPNHIVRTRMNNQSVLYRDGPFNTNLNIDIKVVDSIMDSTGGNPIQSTAVEVPQQVGAFICCKPETMVAIINGTYTTLDTGRGDGRVSRYWFDYSYQYENSNYSERHYVNNAYTQTAVAVGNEPGTNGFDSNYQNPNIPGLPARDEYRYNLEMIGRPQSQNWRLIGYGGFNEPYERNVISGPDFRFATGQGPCDTTDPNYLGDGGGNIMSTQKGFNDGQWIQTGLPGAPTHAHFGCPFERATYETSVNSIYFQDKMTGDCSLGIDFNTGISNGDYYKYTNDLLVTIGNNILQVQALDINNPQTPVVGSLVYIHADTSPIDTKNVTVIAVAPVSAFQFNITLSVNVVADVQVNTAIWLSPTPTGSITGAGVDANPWAGDCLMMRESVAKYNIPSGFYTQEQLANTLNDRLHFDTNKYKKTFGSNNQIPATNSEKERALSSQNTCVNGNFVHTYIPDLNYGFSPITNDNATDLDLTASTKELTNVLYTYDTQPDGLGGFIFYWPSDLPEYNGTTVRKVTDHSTTHPTYVGKHTKLYSVPYLRYDRVNPQIHLIRLRGGALNQADADTNPGPPVSFKSWELKKSRFVGYYEGLRDLRTHFNGENVGNQHGSAYSAVWRTRLNRNLLSCGGSSKIFVGANNLTISFVEEVNRFSLNNLYTPLRPHLSENPTNTGFGIDDAVPSAIIGAELTGQIEDQLSGIYINKLNGDAITRENFGINWMNPILYDTLSAQEIEQYGDNLLDTLGYTEQQLQAFNNSFTNANLFIYNGVNLQSGNAIRVGSKITPAVNGSNPFANSCTLINPVQQYYVEVDSDDFFAITAPTKGKSPYYYIGSDFPAKEFFGNANGSKLPVIGICARNFHSFNFAFDLGASSVSFTVNENKTITSIRTAIYTNDLKVPSNLSKYSSVIYLITKNNYFKSLPDQDQVEKAELIQQNMFQPLAPYFYNQAPANYRSEPPPVIPKDYYEDIGTPPQINEIDTDDDDF